MSDAFSSLFVVSSPYAVWGRMPLKGSPFPDLVLSLILSKIQGVVKLVDQVGTATNSPSYTHVTTFSLHLLSFPEDVNVRYLFIPPKFTYVQQFWHSCLHSHLCFFFFLSDTHGCPVDFDPQSLASRE